MVSSTHCEFVVPPETSCLAHLRKLVTDALNNASFSPAKVNLIALAVDEAVANIMEHGYGGDSGRAELQGAKIAVLLDLTPELLIITIRDKCVRFDPRSAPEVDLKEQIKTKKRGGLGVYLIKRIMDEVNYITRENSENELQLVKYLDDSSGTAKSNGLGLKKAGVALAVLAAFLIPALGSGTPGVFRHQAASGGLYYG
ncbi:MAG: ATP-binding protein [Planctomycetota bacterium]